MRPLAMELLKDSVDYFIFAVLGLMGFITVWLTIERLMFLKKVKISDYETQNDFDEAITKNMTTLYIIYSNDDMGQSGNINASDIMVGLSLALKATALGLAVAIPTLIIYNGLQRKINVLSTRWKSVAGQAS